MGGPRKEINISGEIWAESGQGGQGRLRGSSSILELDTKEISQSCCFAGIFFRLCGMKRRNLSLLDSIFMPPPPDQRSSARLRFEKEGKEGRGIPGTHFLFPHFCPFRSSAAFAATKMDDFWGMGRAEGRKEGLD